MTPGLRRFAVINAISYRTAIVAQVVAALAGCGEERVVSTYRPAPKEPANVLTIGEIDFASQASATGVLIEFPARRRVAIQGRIRGVAGFDRLRLLARPYVLLRPSGNAKRIDANAWLTTKHVTDDVIEYSAVFEPLDRIGRKNLCFHLGQDQALNVVVEVK